MQNSDSFYTFKMSSARKKSLSKNKVQVVGRERWPSDQVYISTKLKFVDSEVHQQMDLKCQII